MGLTESFDTIRSLTILEWSRFKACLDSLWNAFPDLHGPMPGIDALVVAECPNYSEVKCEPPIDLLIVIDAKRGQAVLRRVPVGQCNILTLWLSSSSRECDVASPSAII